MKRFLLLLFATLSLGNIFAIDQECIVYQYNGKMPRTPLGGVYVEVANSGDGAVSQEQTGRLTLKLQGRRLGDAIGNVVVRKTGMMIFNKYEVDSWTVRKAPLVLILCDANEFQKRKEQLIAIGRDLAEKKYKQKMEQLKDQNAKQQLSIDQYYAKLDTIDKGKNNTLAHMDEYADMFARIDESEIDTLAQQAIELLNQGQMEEAIRLFEQGNYLERLGLMVKAQAADLRLKADSTVTAANKDIDDYTKSIRAQVEAYKLKKEWSKAGELLKGLADKQQTLDAIMDYADFALSQKLYDEAEAYLKLYIDKSKSSDHPNVSAMANCYINLAYVSMLTKKFAKAKEYSIEALKADANNHAAYTNIAAAFLLQGKYAEAEQIYRLYKSELKDNFLKDLEEFSNAGVIPTDRKKDVKKIKKILEKE